MAPPLTMYDDLSILKAVTRTSVQPPATSETNGSSIEASLSSHTDEPLDLSFAFISREGIDLAAIKKEEVLQVHEGEHTTTIKATEESGTPLTFMNECTPGEVAGRTFGARLIFIGVSLSLLLLLAMIIWTGQDGTIRHSLGRYLDLSDVIEPMRRILMETIDQHLFFGNLEWILTGRL
ncbi:hypothetical protein [Absidia glauca]|uniref:Uncharacterized protein n=1 Tax=Absidia glauca TaxID=4829 RepID=A0A163J7X0_ABSGL|nr:hypothetical protein [Absidia glauca]